MIFIGRVSRSISCRPKNLNLVLQMSAQVSGDPAKLRRQYLTGFKGQKSDSDTVLEKLQQTFSDVYISSHSDWIRWLAEVATQTLRAGWLNSDWNDISKKLSSWEAVAVEEDGAEKGEQQTFIKLPVQTSSFISEALFSMTKEIHRQCGHTLDKGVIRLLLIDLTERLLSVFQEFVAALSSNSPQWSDKGAVQLLFDILFVLKVLRGSWEGSSKAAEYQGATARLAAAIKAKIDPIDLAIYETHVLRHVERYYSRSSVLFGTLVSLNDLVLEAYVLLRASSFSFFVETENSPFNLR